MTVMTESGRRPIDYLEAWRELAVIRAELRDLAVRVEALRRGRQGGQDGRSEAEAAGIGAAR